MEQQQAQQRTTTSARLRFVLSGQATDVALPAEVPLVDLLPAILPLFGAEDVESAADHEGWVLQRAGEAPLDEDRSLAELNLLDGETVYLRPRTEQLPAIAYDDLVDGVGEVVHDHRGTWRPGHTRWLLRVCAGVALLVGLILTAGIEVGPVRAGFAGLLAMSLLVVSALVARGAANPPVAAILAGASACYATLAGWALMAELAPATSTMVLLTGAGAGALFVLAAAIAAVADAAMIFTGALTFVIALSIPCLIGAVSGLSPQQAIAIGVVVALLASAFVPTTAFRLAGLTLPLLPGGPNELEEEIDAVPQEIVVDRGAATVGYGTALYAGLGLAQALMLPVLVLPGVGWQMVLALVVAWMLLLRSRHPNVLPQRWSVVAPAVMCVVGYVLHIGAEQDLVTMLLAVFVPVLAACAVLILAGQRLPERRLVPPWPRTVEILELLTAIAILPILLQVLDVYSWVHGLAG